MVVKHVHRLTIGDPLQILPQAHAQQQDRFDGNATVVRTVARFQLGTNLCQRGIDLLGEKPVAVGGFKELAREPGRGKEFRLGRERWQAHRRGPDKSTGTAIG